MRALNSHTVLIHQHCSLQSATQIPSSSFSYLKSSKIPTSFVTSFRRTHRRRSSRISSSSAVPVPSIRSPDVRRPRDRPSPGNGQVAISLNSVSASASRLEEVSELEMFLDLVPLRMRNDLFTHPDVEQLIEVVMDLGRKPIARFPSGDWMISEQTVKLEDLDHAISKVGEFSDDNRSGINSSLHRISAIRNRKSQIIGLTCRVGRAIMGSAEIIRDLVEGGDSILVVGPPGVGKTTLIREIARMLADERKKRVVIVDTSNEIGGDGDVPHSGIGFARRMQVPNVDMQHNVMIEAVENHMPETIIIDEIGTELEAMAASTIAQRGVQLVATAHGISIDNIIKNPSLQILVGGIESVTLGDEEARKRKVQKTILERKGPPTFSCAVELISKTECHVHHRLDATVDTILAGKTPLFEIRYMDAEASIPSESTITPPSEENHIDEPEVNTSEDERPETESESESETRKGHYVYNVTKSDNQSMPVYVYIYKILEMDVVQVASVMGLEDVVVTDDIEAADAILVCSSELKQNPWIRRVSKFHQVPVFVIKSNTMAQMVKALRMILGMDSFSSTTKELPPKTSSLDIEIQDDTPPKRKPSLEEIDALEEVRLAIEYIVIPGGEAVELLPRRSDIVARQLELVESYQLAAEYSGTDVNPRLHILPQKLLNKTSKTETKPRLLSNDGGSVTGSRLPLLP